MNKIFLIAASLSFSLFAAEPGVAQFGRIVDLKGSGFISFNGKTREITKGDTIEVGAEIVIEHSGQVSFTDNADHRFHLGNSSSASVTANTVELRGGDLWFQSLNKTEDYKVKTANAMVNYQGGEGILSYDSVKGKTQLMVINSMMKLSNLRSPELNLSVSEGHFSFIDNAYDEGAPRDPTPVGEKTYGQLVGLFIGVAPMDKNSVAIFKDHEKTGHTAAQPKASRAVASVDSEKEDKKIDIDPKMIEEYKNSLLHKTEAKKVVTNKSSTIKVGKKKVVSEKMVFHIYGQTTAPAIASTKDMAPAMKSRAPASVLDQDVPNEAREATKEASVISPYSKDYKNKYKESDKLIDDLKKL
ncbi:MAG: hypothetical protein H7281_00320 [Bacteriovorax sp.]|nr:hypothetical protein [Bacteriovorax sp.]